MIGKVKKLKLAAMMPNYIPIQASFSVVYIYQLLVEIR
ncbi:hypothetical protein RINTHM_14770 [Richelia intracellularis HM01]|nr:hypothetical protein RINTHM_14770 [Richelia intracellularis HM01]